MKKILVASDPESHFDKTITLFQKGKEIEYMEMN